MDVVELASADGSTVARFVPEAGIVCCSLRLEGDEVLAQRDGIEAYSQRGATMGVPLLYPWANRLSAFEFDAAGRRVVLPHDGRRVKIDPTGVPIHGVIPGLMRWQLEGPPTNGAMRATLAWEGRELLELFPFEHEVSFACTVGSGSLEVEVSVRAFGEDAVPVSFGFHPYLVVPGGSPRSGWRVEMPRMERLLTDERQIPTGERQPFEAGNLELGDSDWDDGFALDGDGPAEFAIGAEGWRLAVRFLEGFPYAQVFAPADLALIAFEPMTAPADALCGGNAFEVVAPGGEYRARFCILGAPPRPDR